MIVKIMKGGLKNKMGGIISKNSCWNVLQHKKLSVGIDAVKSLKDHLEKYSKSLSKKIHKVCLHTKRHKITGEDVEFAVNEM